MLRHVCVVSLALLLTINFGGLLVQEADASNHGWGNRKTLETFEFAGVAFETFVLPFDPEDPDEYDFDRYVFELAADPTPGIDEYGVSVVYIEVHRVGTNDLACRGVVADIRSFSINQYCDALRQGHHYEITLIGSTPATLTLSGVNPIGP